MLAKLYEVEWKELLWTVELFEGKSRDLWL
jgi:hypothetical protein